MAHTRLVTMSCPLGSLALAPAAHSTATTARGLHLPCAAASHTHAGHTCRKMEKWSPGTSMTSQSSHMSYQQAPCGTTAQHTRKGGQVSWYGGLSSGTARACLLEEVGRPQGAWQAQAPAAGES
jgi:hypothetical protein